MAKLYPLNDNIIVEREPSDKVTAGGIILPDIAQQRPQFGLVVGIFEPFTDDEGHYREPRVKVGQMVALKKYAGQEFEMGRSTYTIISQRELLGVIRPEPGDEIQPSRSENVTASEPEPEAVCEANGVAEEFVAL